MRKLGVAILILLSTFMTSQVVAQPVCVRPPAGLSHWWTGDFNGKDVIDGADVRPINGAGYMAGYVDGAFSLDGLNDYFVSTPLKTTSTFTIEAWVNLRPKNSTDWRVNQGIVSQYIGGSGPYFILEASSRLGWLGLWDGNWGGGGFALANQWRHIAVVREAGVRKRFYMDGQQVSSAAVGGYGPLTHSILIGYAGDQSRFARGLIDEVSYYNRALSAAEIQSIHLAGTAGKCLGPDDTQAPSFVSRAIDFDADTGVVSGSVALDEAGSVTVTVSDEGSGATLNATTVATATNTPFYADFQLSLDRGSLPPIVRVTLRAVDAAGNQAPDQALLLDTSVTSSGVNEPSTGVSIRIEGALIDMSGSAEQGRPTVDFTSSSSVDVVFRLTQEQALSLCGLENTCVIYVDGVPMDTSRVILPGGGVEFRLPMSGSGGVRHVVLGFDPSVGGAGVAEALDPNTGNVFSVDGDVVQTTFTFDGNAVITAGDRGGQMTVSFTLSPDQDVVKCAGQPGVCTVLENRTAELSTTRTILPDGRVRYAAAITMQPGTVNLYSLKVLDQQPPVVGNITITVPVIRGGDTTDFRISISDNTRVIQVTCLHFLPDGRVIEVRPVQLSDGSWGWSFTPPADSPSGEVVIEVVVTDLGGNTVTLRPSDTSGRPASVLLDNDTPLVIIPQDPIAASRVFNGVPVAGRGECVTLHVTASDQTSGIDELVFIVTRPDGSEVEVRAGETVPGTYAGQICIDVDAPGGLYGVRVVATDIARNHTIIQCKSFAVNTPPLVDAGEGIWVAPGQDAAFAGSFTDPDQGGTHTLAWDLGDGTFATGTLTPAHAYLAPGIYTATLTVTDSYGGVGADTRIIYVVGTGMSGDMRGAGFWKHQFRHGQDDDGDDKGKGKKKGQGNGDDHGRQVSDNDLLLYMTLIRQISQVFDGQVALTSLVDGGAILDIDHASMRQRALQHTLAAWLNFAHGAIGLSDMVDTDGDASADSRFIDAMTAIEAILLNPNASTKQLEMAKDMAENLNEDGGED